MTRVSLSGNWALPLRNPPDIIGSVKARSRNTSGDRSGSLYDVHCHGMGVWDFSDFDRLDLLHLDRLAARERVMCILTMYLPQDRLQGFIQFMERFHELRGAGALTHLIGVALEGPM